MTRFRSHLIVLAALALFVAAAHAAEITAVSNIEPQSVLVRAHRIDGAAEPIERRLQIPGASNIALPEGLWEIRLVSDTLWAAPVYVRDVEAATMRILPTVTLRGTARSATAMRLRFTPVDPAGAAGEAECEVEKGAWNCALPAGRYDLRFTAAGFAPEMLFDVQVPAPADIPLQFVAGASLAARLEAAGGAKLPLEGVEVTLTGPAGRHTTQSTAKGLFHFKGLAPGEYSLRARKEGFTAQVRSVTIVAGAAAELSTPLLLDRPKKLNVTIAPPLDPALEPWHVSLGSFDAARRKIDAVSESQASADGQWTHSGLVAGEYCVDIRRASGQLWASQTVNVGHADVTLPLMALSERVTGRVMLGKRPIAASLAFGGETGATLQSDEHGRFEGDIPPGEPERMVVVQAEALNVTRTIRVRIEGGRILIRLPATTLMGRAVLDDGTPQPHAIITIDGEGELLTHQTFAADDGQFQIDGLEPGRYRVDARTADGKSDRVPVTLAEDEAAEAELIVRPHVAVRGRVSIGSVPVVQAEIHAIPRDAEWAPFMPHTITTERGLFVIELPPRTRVYDLVVIHPAFDVVLARTTAQGDKILTVGMHQLGGTLTVSSTQTSDLLVKHNGGEFWLTWVAGKAGGAVRATEVVIPRLEPGEYSVCSAKTRRCVSGYLPPHGTLTLEFD